MALNFNFNFNNNLSSNFSKFARKSKHTTYNDDNILFDKTTNLYSLVKEVRENGHNKISASTITYSYNHETEDESEIVKIKIGIEGIKENISDYQIYLLDKDATLFYNEDVAIPNVSIDNLNKFSIYKFKPLITNKNLFITIKCKVNHKQDANLYFFPKSYVQNVDTIKIETENKDLYCYLSNGSDYENAVILGLKNNSIVLNNKNLIDYVNSIFFVSDYNR